MRELSLHLMDLVQNSIAADAKEIKAVVHEDTKLDLLQMIVEDNGKGMDAGFLAMVTDPFTTSRTTRKVGLGIPLLKEAAEQANGFLTIESQPGKGTRVVVQFQRSHIDRMPLGDLASTLQSLVVAYPDIQFLFEYSVDENRFIYDSRDVKEVLQDIPMCDPAVLSFLRNFFEDGVYQLQNNAS